MKKDEVIKLAKSSLKSVPGIKAKIRLMDRSLAGNTLEVEQAKKIQLQRDELYSLLIKIINAIGSLEEDNQRIVCYKYFDKLTNEIIGIREGVAAITVIRRIDEILLDVGRILFGFEDEFWQEFLPIDPSTLYSDMFMGLM